MSSHALVQHKYSCWHGNRYTFLKPIDSTAFVPFNKHIPAPSLPFPGTISHTNQTARDPRKQQPTETKFKSTCAYLKTSERLHTFRAFVSGERSAVFLEEGVLYRLKGCGSWERGIVVEDRTGIVRGTSSVHSSIRELYTNSLVQQLYLPLSMANTGLGYVCYPDTGGTLSCTVFQTLGDRRMGTHLLSGMDMLLLASDSSIPQTFLSDIGFPLVRVDPLTHLPTPTYIHLLEHEGKDVLFNANDCTVPVCLLSDNGERKDESRTLLQQQDHTFVYRLMYRLGHEVGHFMRTLHQNGVSWGTFREEKEGVMHCNAHVNNLVVLSEQSDGGGEQLLAPLDLDMAFRETEYEGNGGDLDTFEQVVFYEKKAMMQSLAGDLMSSSGTSNDFQMEDTASVLVQSVKCVLRDTLVSGFLHGYDNLTPRPVLSERDLAMSYRLIERCLWIRLSA